MTNWTSFILTSHAATVCQFGESKIGVRIEPCVLHSITKGIRLPRWRHQDSSVMTSGEFGQYFHTSQLKFPLFNLKFVLILTV